MFQYIMSISADVQVRPGFLTLAWVGIHLARLILLLPPQRKRLIDSLQVVGSAYSVLILVAVSDGLGHHVWDTRVAELPKLP